MVLVYHYGHILAKQVAYFKALGKDTSPYLDREKELVATKGEKCLTTTYI